MPWPIAVACPLAVRAALRVRLFSERLPATTLPLRATSQPNKLISRCKQSAGHDFGGASPNIISAEWHPDRDGLQIARDATSNGRHSLFPLRWGTSLCMDHLRYLLHMFSP
jgi:hypothetical protein